MTSKLSRTEIIEEVRARRFSERARFFEILDRKTHTPQGIVPWPWALLIVSAEDWNDAFDQMLSGSADEAKADAKPDAKPAPPPEATAEAKTEAKPPEYGRCINWPCDRLYGHIGPCSTSSDRELCRQRLRDSASSGGSEHG